MPTVDENARGWGVDYDWKQRGEEWSARWGSSEAQWFGSILPRIHAFLPVHTILEIGPGYGRWTYFLQKYCDRLIAVDLCESCITVCSERFAGDDNISFHINDGKDLSFVPDGKVDFVFSFDSLVHAEVDVFDAYLEQLARKLSRDGVGYIHHSNIGEYAGLFQRAEKWPAVCQKTLRKLTILDRIQWRAFSMTAAVFEQCCERAGLQCICQEQVNWGSRRAIDCFSTFVRRNSKWARPNSVARNRDFMKEAELVRRWSRLSLRREVETRRGPVTQ
jgi:SAM-dependent methyltransferase